MRVIIFGASGYIGSNLTRHLETQGCDVHVIRHTDIWNEHATTVDVDSPLTASANSRLILRLRDINADAVVMAGGGHYRGTWRDPFPTVDANLISQIGIIAAVTQAEVPRIISLGSYWQDMMVPQSSSPTSLYGACKNATEALLSSAIGMGSVITTLHLHDVYGPDDDRNKIFGQLARALTSGTPLAVQQPQAVLIPVHIHDVCSAVEEVMSGSVGDSGTHEILRIDGDEMLTVRQLVQLAREINPQLLATEDETTSGLGGPSLRCIHDRPPGWTPMVSLEEGLQALLSRAP